MDDIGLLVTQCDGKTPITVFRPITPQSFMRARSLAAMTHGVVYVIDHDDIPAVFPLYTFSCKEGSRHATCSDPGHNRADNHARV